MGLNQLGFITVGTLVSEEAGHTSLHNTLLVILPWSGKPPLFFGPHGQQIKAYRMQPVVKKAITRWIAANLISGHLAHAGKHRHGSAGHNQGRSRAPKAADV